MDRALVYNVRFNSWYLMKASFSHYLAAHNFNQLWKLWCQCQLVINALMPSDFLYLLLSILSIIINMLLFTKGRENHMRTYRSYHEANKYIVTIYYLHSFSVLLIRQYLNRVWYFHIIRIAWRTCSRLILGLYKGS